MSAMRVVLSSAIVVVAALLLIACGSGQKTESTPVPSTTTQPGGTAISVATSTALPAAPTATPAGQSTPSSQKQIGDLLITVNGARLYSDDVLPAAPGTHYVAVDVTIKNTGNQDYILNILNFRLEDSDGHIHDAAITGGPKPQIGSRDNVVPRQEERGFIVFPLPDGSDPAELQYRSPAGVTGSMSVPKPSP